MSRISIDVTDEQYARLEALAARQGLSIEKFVLVSALGEGRAGDDLVALELLLDQRVARARSEGVSQRTVGDVFRRARRDVDRAPGA